MDELNRYRAVQAGTTDRRGLLLMLLDGILRELARGRRLLAEGGGGAELPLMKAFSGVAELDRTLNHEASPELALALHNLYLHLLSLLAEGLEGRRDAPLARAERILGELRSAWKDAFDRAREGAA